MGVFQIESRAQMQSLHRTRPESLDDLTIQVAIVRPGPILGGAVNPYIERRQRLREDPDFVVPYDHPSLEPVLRDTLGTIIFQDQVIEVAMAFAGFSPGEAEGLRRAMSRKRSEAAIEAYHERFIEGAARTHGVDAETAERVYAMIVGFSGFGFPKAHGAAFGLLAYQSTWLRVHYGPEFLCALLNEQPMGFYAPDTLAHEAQRKGIELIAPDVNLSREECTVDAEGRIRLGLNYVLGARSDEVAALVAAREEGGPFRSLADLASRAGAGRAILDRLAWAGACDALAAADVAAEAQAAGRAARLRPASGGAVARRHRPAPPTRRGAVRLARAADRPVAARRRRARRGGPGGHAARAAARAARRAGARPARGLGRDGGRLRDDRAHARPAPGRAAAARAARRARSPRATSRRCRTTRAVTIGGLVVARQRPGTAKGIVFLLLEDEFGTINLIVPPPVYERHRLAVRTEPLLLARGQAGEAADGRRGAQRLRARAAAAVRAGHGGRAEVVALPDRGGAGDRPGVGEAEEAGRGRAGRLPRRRAGGAELRRGKAAVIGDGFAARWRQPAAQMGKVRPHGRPCVRPSLRAAGARRVLPRDERGAEGCAAGKPQGRKGLGAIDRAVRGRRSSCWASRSRST